MGRPPSRLSRWSGQSRLLKAVNYKEGLEMPPTGRLA